jgi:tripartite-type tricarboxylate transporter receptor subunit TctC
MDILRSDEQRQIFQILMGMKALGRPYFLAPDVPKDRSDALRAAFMETMSDPEYREEAKRVLGIVDPTSGGEMQKIVTDVYALPTNIIEKARDAMKVSEK